jgi:hypothetical protein
MRAATLLSLGFQKILDVLSRNGPGAFFAREGRNRTAPRGDFGGRLNSAPNQIRHYAAEAFCPFLGEMFRKAQNVFVYVQGGPHDPEVNRVDAVMSRCGDITIGQMIELRSCFGRDLDGIR